MGTAPALDEEQQADTWTALLHRLSHQSVVKHFDAYADVPWDDPDYAIDPADPRWEAGPDNPLSETAWYRSQPAATKARMGLHDTVGKMKIGVQFESILKRGLLEYAATLDNGSPEFRYAYHEVIEEAQHSLMFQEFVNRAGLPAAGMPKAVEFAARRVVHLGRKSPALFFMFVLGGEDPIDHVQRETLRSGREVHPLLQRIMQIHVTEEARHLSFARNYLKTHVPALSRRERFRLAVRTPFILGSMAQLMLRPSPALVRTYGIPKEALRQAYDRNPAHKAAVRRSLRKVRNLAVELGLITPLSKLIWKAFGIWEDAAATA